LAEKLKNRQIRRNSDNQKVSLDKKLLNSLKIGFVAFRFENKKAKEGS
jgi:hypothetical protein